MRVELEDGAWAKLRDPRKLTGRQSEILEDAQYAVMVTDAGAHLADPEAAERFEQMPRGEQMRVMGVDGMRAFREVQRATVLCYVAEWSYGDVTRDVLLDEVPDTQVVIVASKIGDVIKAVGAPAVNVEPDPDPGSPT